MSRPLFFLFAVLCVATVTGKESTQGELNQIICGPRCVQYVLRHFGTEVDLIDLVREMQWPLLTEGVSAASIVESLEKRGLHVKTIQVDPKSAVFEWKYPIILHLEPDNENSLGHFIVRMPESTGSHFVLYDGLAGFRVEARALFAKKMSGAALLISPNPIRDDELVVYRSVALWPWGVGVAVLLVTVTLCVHPIVARTKRRKRKNDPLRV